MHSNVRGQKRVIDFPGFNPSKARRLDPELFRPAIQAAQSVIGSMARRIGGGGGGVGYGSGSVVTTQNDFKQARGRTRVMTKKQKRRARKIKRLIKRRVKKFKFKVKKAVQKPGYMCSFVENVGRSYVSNTNSSCAVLIPLYAWRGQTTASSSDSRNAAGGSIAGPSFYQDSLSKMWDFYKNTRWFPSGAAANTQVTQCWFKHMSTALDITLSNCGDSAEGVSNTTNRAVPIEYEIYKVWAGKKAYTATDAPALNTLTDVFTAANSNQQLYGSASAVTYPNYNFADPGYAPWKQTFTKPFLKGKKLGEGYINPGGGAARFRFYAKRKNGYYSKAIVEKMDFGAADVGRGIYPGHFMGIVVVFRGVPNGVGTTTQSYFHPQARMSFLCNWLHKTKTSGDPQPGTDTRYIRADDYA